MKRPTNFNSYIEEVHDYCIDCNSNQLFLHSHPKDEDNSIEVHMATMFLKNMSILEKNTKDTIRINIMSYGGNLSDGFIIYDAIKTSPNKTTIVCHGYCMSMATVILQAGTTRLSMPNCEFMIHDVMPCLSSEYNRKQTKSWIDAVDKNKQKLFNIYADHMKEAFNGSISKAKSFLTNKLNTKEDWIIDAEEALKYNLIDGILEKGDIRTSPV